MSSTPFANIALTGAIIVGILLIGGIVLELTGHGPQGDNLISLAIGTLAGSAATTTVVQRSSGPNVPPG